MRPDIYADEAGFCTAVKLEKIRKADYLLTPGHYMGGAALEADAGPFEEEMAPLTPTVAGLQSPAAMAPAKVRTVSALLATDAGTDALQLLTRLSELLLGELPVDAGFAEAVA